MPVSMLYPLSKQANRCARPLAVAAALALTGCGPFNPNVMTVIQREYGSYTIEGAITPGFASRPKVGYVMGEGDNPDQGSFRNRGAAGAGITPQGIYYPSELITLDTNKRFHITFESPRRFVLVKIFAWDDTNSNGVRDTNEALAAEYQLRKEDMRGWSFNAPDWNQFNFTFTR